MVIMQHFLYPRPCGGGIVARGIPVYAWKGETLDDYDWCIEQTIVNDGQPWAANMVIADGADLTLMLHEKYPSMLDSWHHEETTTGVQLNQGLN